MDLALRGLKNEEWVDVYYCRVVVFTNFQHTRKSGFCIIGAL